MTKQELGQFIEFAFKLRENKREILKKYVLAICDEDISKLYSVAKALQDYYL